MEHWDYKLTFEASLGNNPAICRVPEGTGWYKIFLGLNETK